MAKPDSKKKIADIGCGEGFLIKEIPVGEKIIGIEISTTALRRAKKIVGFKKMYFSYKVMHKNYPFQTITLISFYVVKC